MVSERKGSRSAHNGGSGRSGPEVEGESRRERWEWAETLPEGVNKATGKSPASRGRAS